MMETHLLQSVIRQQITLTDRVSTDTCRTICLATVDFNDQQLK